MSSSRKRNRAKAGNHYFHWTDFPRLIQWEILRWVITMTRDPQFLKNIRLVSKVWNDTLTDWIFWFPIFEKIRIERQKLVPEGIEYLVRPESLKHLNPIDLYATKIPVQGKWPSGLGTVIRGGSLYEGNLWGGLFHGPGALYEHSGNLSPALRYQGHFKEHHLHCIDGECEYLMSDGTVFNGTIEYRNGHYYCNGLFRYSDQHPRFPGKNFSNRLD